MPKLIMVMNDTQEILELFESILTEEGYRVSLHSYRMRDLETIKKIRPDLLLIDQLFGEEYTGWQTIQKMKMDRETSNIPILVCSAEIRVIRELEGHLKQKNVGVIIKPFDIDELVNAVRDIVGGPEKPDEKEEGEAGEMSGG